MKKFIAVVLSSITIFSSSVGVLASANLSQVMVIKENKNNNVLSPMNTADFKLTDIVMPSLDDNNKRVEIKNGGLVYKDEMFYAIRDLANALNLKVEYIQDLKVVSIDNGKIYLPINTNKAVVDGKIVSYPKISEELGTILVNGKAYVPSEFINEIFYNNMNKEASKEDNGFTKLDKKQAVEAYKAISKASNEIKNSTIEQKVKSNSNIKQGDNTLNTKVESNSIISMDIKDKLSIYGEQEVKMDLMGQKLTVNQKMYYKDGIFYVDQGDLKIKMPLNIDEVLKASNSMDIDSLIDEQIILGGSVKELENGKKMYSFDIDFNKSIDMAKDLSKDLLKDVQNGKELDIYKGLKISNTTIFITVDSKNQPVDMEMKFTVEVNLDGLVVKNDIETELVYKNIDTTVVKQLEGDLSEYKGLDSLAS